MALTLRQDELKDRADAAMVLIPGDVIWWGVVGSRLYGVATDDSDTDLGFVYARPTDDFLGVHPPLDKKLTCEGVISQNSHKVEFTAHEVGKFSRLLLKGNPTMIEWLFMDPEWSHASWGKLRQQRNSFLTQQVINQYLGYIGGQLERLRKGLKLHTAKGGTYNTKWAYHMLRLAWDAFEIATGNPPQIHHLGEAQSKLRAVRVGAMASKDVIALVEQVVAEVEHKRKAYDVPDERPTARLNKWLLATRQEISG